MTKVFFLVVALALFLLSLGDTKILHNVEIRGDDSYRRETFSLKNVNTPQEELVIEGNHVVNIFPDHDRERGYLIKTIYVADKDGYRVKYKLELIFVLEDKPMVSYINTPTLKSLSG